MRRPSETALKDSGNAARLEVDNGAGDVSHWSPEENRVTWKAGDPVELATTHPSIAISEPEAGNQLGSQLALTLTASLIFVILVGAPFLGAFDFLTAPRFGDGRTTEADQSSGTFARGRQLLDVSTQHGDEAPVESTKPSMLTSLGNEADKVRHAVAATAELERALQQERERYAVLAGKVEDDRVAFERAMAQSSKSDDDAVKRIRAAEGAAEDLRQSLQQEKARAAALASQVAEANREIESRDARLRASDNGAAQQGVTAAQKIADLGQSLQKEQEKSAGLARQVEAAQAAIASAAEQYHEVQARAAALASELAGAARAGETANARSGGTDRSGQQIEAADQHIDGLTQSLRQEGQNSTRLANDAKAAQMATASAEQERREPQARAAVLNSEFAEAPPVADRLNADLSASNHSSAQQTGAELPDLPQAGAEQLARKLRTSGVVGAADAQTPAGGDVPAQRTGANAELRQPQQDQSVTEVTGKDLTSAGPLDTDQDNREAARLISRARRLLEQGNIGAARIVLELAAEKHSAQASFMLAETYDPGILSAWGTYGTRADAAKAQEHYARALRGGIDEAHARLDALRR